MSRNTVARINLSAIRQNLARVRGLAPRSLVACVVKADGYGHGLANVVPALDDADILAVATIGEAERCRDLGWQGRLLMLEGATNFEERNAAIALGCELVVHHESQLELLTGASGSESRPSWLKLDSGMHRLGFPLGDAGRIFDQIRELSGTPPGVLMSHFACADQPDNPITAAQMARFDSATEGMDGQVSLANSAAVMNFPESHRDIVRPGIMLYGVSPCSSRDASEIGIRPAMTLQADLIAINRVNEGEPVGYGGNQRCAEDMNIGVIAIGYGDGYPHGVRQGTPVLIHGRRAPLIGPVSMDLTTVDLREHPDARVGDTVTLWGDGLPVEEIAQWAGTIPYELVCGVTARVHPVIEQD